MDEKHLDEEQAEVTPTANIVVDVVTGSTSECYVKGINNEVQNMTINQLRDIHRKAKI